MNKKNRKLLTWCLVICLIMTNMLFANVAFAATNKLAGTDRYQTALKVVQAGWTKSDNVVIARGDDIADALAAAPLAYAKGKSPILLTETNALPAGVLDEIAALGVKTVYIVGGTGAVSTAVQEALAAKVTSVVRVSGNDRYATSLAIAKEAFPTAPTKAVMVNGEAIADALSIASIAAYNGMPILLVGKDAMATDVAAYLTGKAVYAVGGVGVISDTVASNATRLAGADRYATNVAVLKAFTLNYADVFVAVGEDDNAVDALGGAAFAALNNNPIFLAYTALTADASALLSANLTTASDIYVLGGVVPAGVVSAMEALVPAVPATLSVQSVTSLNAKQLQITFNKAVYKDSVLNDQGTKSTSDDVLLATAVELSELDGQGAPNIITEGSAKASLSADGAVLTITAQTTEYFKGRYAVAVLVSVKDANKTALASKYTTTLNVNDTTRPTLTDVVYNDYETALVRFSEPIASIGTVSYKLANGNTLTTNPTATLYSNKSIQIDLSGINAADVNKDIVVTVVGAVDYNGNVITPNPVTVTVKKDTTDTTKPTVSSVTVTGNNTFDIKFSEELMADPIIANIAANVVTLAQDTVDYTIYHCTIAAAVSGLQTIAVSGITDLSDVDGDNYSKAVNFAADSTAPTFVSSSVEIIDGVEYLVLTYNENVVPIDAIAFTPTYLDNYVTTNGATLTTETATVPVANAPFTLYKPVDSKSTSVKLVLTALTKAATYTADLPQGIVTDVYANVSAKQVGVSFTRTSNASIGAPKLDATFDTNGVKASITDNNKLTVQFDKAVEGASATTVSNYSVEGATVTKAVLTANTTNGTVELTLDKDSNTLTGVRTITVSGVKSQIGAVMTTAVTSELLNENVRPTITKAEVTTTTTITLTFSSTIYNASATDDFDVYVGGVKVDPAKVSTALTVAATPSKTLVITLTDALTASQLSSGIVVKPTSTINVNDATLAGVAETTGNALNFTSITVQ